MRTIGRLELLIAAGLLALSAGCASGGGTSPDGGAATASAPLQVTDMDGASYDLDAALARGETVALVFWQVWCESCKAEAPKIAAAAAEHGKRIRFVGVVPGRDDTVDDGEVCETQASWHYEFPQVRDRDMSLTKRFGVKGTPTILVLGKDREVLFNAHRAPADWATLEGTPIASAAPTGPANPYAEIPGMPSAGGPAGECHDGVCPLPEAAE